MEEDLVLTSRVVTILVVSAVAAYVLVLIGAAAYFARSTR
jgi:hypothetical protein